MTPTQATSVGTELSSAGRTVPAAAVTSVDRFQRLLEGADESAATPFQNVNAWTGAAAFQALQPLVTTPLPAATTVLRELAPHLCSAAYVARGSSRDHSHLLVALDGAIAGVSAEFVRAGAFLQVRLHARSESAYRLMSAQRAALSSAVAAVTPLSVSVEVVYDTGEDHGGAA